MGFVLPGAGGGSGTGDSQPFSADDLINLTIESLDTVGGTENIILRTTSGLRLATTKQVLMQTLSAAGTLAGSEDVVLRTTSGPVKVALSNLRAFFKVTAADIAGLTVDSLSAVDGTENVLVRTTSGLHLVTTKQILSQTLAAAGALVGTEEVILRTATGPVKATVATLKTFFAFDVKTLREKMRVLKRLTGDSTVLGADQWMWTSSGTTSKAAILQIVKDNFMAADEAYKAVAEHILVEVAAVSGGSGCAFGGTACQGGIPGIVRQRQFWLSDLLDSDIPYVVGSGGVPGAGSGASYFGQVGNQSHVYASGVQRGGNDAAEHTLYFEWAIAYGLDPNTARVHTLPYNNSYASDVDRPSALRGPGGGGAAFTSRGRAGHGSMGSISNGYSAGGYPGGPKNGAAGNLKFFDSMGGGGSGNGAAVGGGNGGVPGGGGGSAASDPTSAGYGYGGAGAIKLRFSLKEISAV